MITQVIKINPLRIEQNKIKAVVEVLQKGGVIVYPTDTFYGLGASCFSERAVDRVYRLKKRKPSRPISILVSDADTVKEVKDIAVDIPSLFWKLISKFWPGPLTIVLKASAKLPKSLLGPNRTIGVRQPAFLWLEELLRQVAFPITATSANISGDKEIADAEKVKDIFYGKVDLIVDGGKTKGILPSTVIDLTSEKPVILREGAVPRSQLEKHLKEIIA